MASEGGNPETDRWWRLSQLFRSVAPDEGEQRIRIRFMERHTMLPVKAVYFLVLIYYLYFSDWSEPDTVRWTLFRTIQWFFFLCLIVNTVIAVMLIRCLLYTSPSPRD